MVTFSWLSLFTLPFFSCHIEWGRIAFLTCPCVFVGAGGWTTCSVGGVWQPGCPPHRIKDPGAGLPLRAHALQAFKGAGCLAFWCYLALVLDGSPAYLLGLWFLLHVRAASSACLRQEDCLLSGVFAGWLCGPGSRSPWGALWVFANLLSQMLRGCTWLASIS